MFLSVTIPVGHIVSVNLFWVLTVLCSVIMPTLAGVCSPPCLRCLLSSWRQPCERCLDPCSPAQSHSRCWSAEWTCRCPRSSRPGCPPQSCCVCAWDRTAPEQKTHCSESAGTPLPAAARSHHPCTPYSTCRVTEKHNLFFPFSWLLAFPTNSNKECTI